MEGGEPVLEKPVGVNAQPEEFLPGKLTGNKAALQIESCSQRALPVASGETGKT